MTCWFCHTTEKDLKEQARMLEVPEDKIAFIRLEMPHGSAGRLWLFNI